MTVRLRRKKYCARVSISRPAVRHPCRAQVFVEKTAANPADLATRNNEGPAMNTVLITTQIVAYGVGIVSASLNIAVFVRRRRARWQLRRLLN